MATLPNVKARQDLPPKGGYPEINFKKGMRPRGPSGAIIWALITASSIYGLSQLGVTNEQNRYNRKEQREGRIAIMPFLLAEQDGMIALEQKKALEYEAKVMKNVPGWVVGESVLSKGARWQKPTITSEY